MVKINVSTPRTALLLLILIVGCGLILSLVRMSDMPSTAYYTSSKQYISNILKEAAAEQNTDSNHFQDSPTRFEDDSTLNLMGQESASSVSPLPSSELPTSESSSVQQAEGTISKQLPVQSNSEQSTEETGSEPSSNEPSPEKPTDDITSESATDRTISESASNDKQLEQSAEPSTEESRETSLNKEPSKQATQKLPTEGDQGIDQTNDQRVNVEYSTDDTKQPSENSDLPPSTTGNDSGTETENIPVTTRSGPVHVLLLTEGRSGSTWLSSYFWHRPEVYYTFEPLFQTPAWKNAGCSATPEKRQQCDEEVLSHFWKCDFHSSRLSVLGRYPQYHLDKSKKYSSEDKERMCNEATHRVAKTIRLWDLTHIENIMKDSEHYDVRVIHLVRDPRPLLKSRSKGGFGSLDGIHKTKDFSDESFEEQCATVCKRMLEASRLGDSPPDWLKDRYVRITHEQMSLRPIETARMLYRFADLSWTEETEEYIRNTTIGAVGHGGMFGIAKVSTKVVNEWKMMKETLITKITGACYETIKYLNYETDLEKIRQWKLNNADLFTEDELDKLELDKRGKDSNDSNLVR